MQLGLGEADAGLPLGVCVAADSPQGFGVTPGPVKDICRTS